MGFWFHIPQGSRSIRFAHILSVTQHLPNLLAVGLALLFAVACAPGPRPLPARSGCPDGDALVQVEAEAAGLSGCADLSGSLAVGPSFALRSLTGLASLARIRGGLEVSHNALLTGLYLPALRAVDGDLVIDNNRQLETASLHHVSEVRGDLVVRDNAALTRLDLGALRRVHGRLSIEGHPALDVVVLDSLESAGELVIEEDPAWPAEEIDRLRRAVRPVPIRE